MSFFCFKQEMLNTASLASIADALTKLLHPHAEVVIHDLATEQIAYISNPISHRVPGDPSLTELSPEEIEAGDVIGPYPKTNPDGRSLKSITAVLRGDDAKPYGLMCINVDVSMVETLHAVLGNFLKAGQEGARPQSLFEKDWREEANDIVGRFLADRRTVIDRLSPQDRSRLIGELDTKGIFNIRNAAPYVARILGLSRATLYKAIKTSREDPS